MTAAGAGKSRFGIRLPRLVAQPAQATVQSHRAPLWPVGRLGSGYKAIITAAAISTAHGAMPCISAFPDCLTDCYLFDAVRIRLEKLSSNCYTWELSRLPNVVAIIERRSVMQSPCTLSIDREISPISPAVPSPYLREKNARSPMRRRRSVRRSQWHLSEWPLDALLHG